MMKRLLPALSLFIIVFGALIFLRAPQAQATFNPNNLIDDAVFTNYSTMSAAQIDSWLNSSFPSSCISTNHGFSAPDPTGYSPSTGFSYGGAVSAGRVIYDSAQAYGINPQVLLVTLQKEQSLVSGDAGCSTLRYAAATGYGCPDGGTTHSYSNLNPPLYYINGSAVTSVSGTCVNSATKAGFSQQVIRAAWLLMFGQQRSRGNTDWAVIKGGWDNSDDPQTCYGGPMTQGYRKRCSWDANAVFYDGYITIDGSSTHMDTGATAALYWYTPHFSGNQHFDSLFTSWFGSTSSIASGVTMTNISQPDTTPALGQTVTYTIALTNNLSDTINIDAVGIVGRLGSLTGDSRDFDWQGPVALNAGATQQFTFTSIIKDYGTIYVWPAIYAQGLYKHYNNWGAALNSHIPNLGLSVPLTSSLSNPIASQTGTLSATLKNNETEAIRLDTLGIPVRLYGTYSYDTAWSASPVTLQAGGTQAISGNITFDKAGPYSAWVSSVIGNQYITNSNVLNLTATTPVPKFQLSYVTTPDLTPALGEDVTIQFKLKNNSGIAMTLDAVGVVGRYDNPYNGPNRDFGWQGPESFAAGEEKTYTFTSNVATLNNFYAWVAIRYQGSYIHYNNWGFMLTPHIPNLTTSVPVTVNSGTQPNLNQTVPVTVTIKNNEANPIKFSALGIPARYYGVYNYDAVWQGAGTLAASGQSGDSITLNGSITFDKPGPYTLWASINIQGKYITIGNVKTINM